MLQNITQIDEAITAVENAGYKVKSNGYNSYRCQCPAHGGDGLNMVLSQKGDKLLAVCHSHGCTFQEIMQSIGLYGKPRPTEPKRIVQKEPVRNKYNARMLSEAIGDALYFDKARLKPYLLSRGITVEVPEDIFFLERCFHSKTNSYLPAMFCLIRNENKKIISATRIYIPGDKKLHPPMKMPAVIPGETAGCSVHCQTGEESVLFAFEGVENALAGMQLMLPRKITAWAFLGTAGVAKMKIPPQFKTIYIMADKDPDDQGVKAAMEAKKRLERWGRKVFVLPPKSDKGKCDWNDVLMEEAV